MALDELALTMQVLADEDILAIIMDNVDGPKTLFNLVIALPIAKATFERCPRQLLMAALSSLHPEIQLLAILYIALKPDHVSRASMVSLLWAYLGRDDTPGFVEPPVASIDLEVPRNIPNPFEMLRELAAVWSAVEVLADGFIECSIEFIQTYQAAEQPQRAYYEHGHKLRPLSHLWDREVSLDGLPGYQSLDKPQPWSLPLKASEIHRVRRALWRIEIFALISYDHHAFPSESALELGASDIHRANPVGTLPIPPDHDEGTRMFLASLQGSELAELESIYSYLWRTIIGRAYYHKLDAYVAQYGEKFQQAQAEGKGGTTSGGVEHREQEHDSFRTQFVMGQNTERARKEFNRYLTHLMSLGLPFLHRMHQQLQITQEDDKILPRNYPPLQYRSLSGLRDTWVRMDSSRNLDIFGAYSYNIWRSYNYKLVHTNAGKSVSRRSEIWDESPDLGSFCAMYLQTRYTNGFYIENLWRAGCYMWERGERE